MTKAAWLVKVSMKKMVVVFALLVFWTNLSAFPDKQRVLSGLERYLSSQMREHGLSGEVLVASGDEIFLKKGSHDSSSSRSKVSQPEVTFPAGSTTEQFLAAAILKLESSGQVDLHNSICEYLSNCPHGWNDIQVLHLLSHSSGLPDLSDFPPCLESPAVDSGSSAIIAALSRAPLLFKPGSRFNANKFDYYFVSLLIERISGQSSSAYLQHHIFLPLKLAHTGYEPRRAHLASFGDVRRTEACPRGQSDLNSIPSYFADEMSTTIGDLYVWDKALISGQFLSKSSLDKMFTPYVEGHGFGWKIVKEFDRMAVLQSHDLGATSFSSRIYPDDATCILVVSRTREAPATSISHDLGAILFGKHYPAFLKPDPTRTPR